MDSRTERKLNVLLVVPWDQETGGVAAVVGYLARHLEAQGHRVLFLNPGSSEIVQHKTTKWGFPGVEIKLRAPFNPDYPIRSRISFAIMFPYTLFRLAQLVRKNQIRVVNIHFPGEHFVYFAFCKWLMRVPLVISIHGMDAIKWDAPLAKPSRALRALFRAADLVVAPSWRFLRRCDELLAPFSARKVAIHNGTEVAERESNAIGVQSEPFILSVCSLDEWKGVDVLISAMATLRDRGENTRLIVAGDGPERESLRRLIADLGLEQHVELIGQQSRESVSRLLDQCTLFVLASRFETFGIAALEAMAAGKAVIGTRVDGILEIIDDGENGVLVDSEDPIALSNAIHALLCDSALRERLGQAARARVKTQFQRQRMGENYMHAFQEVVTHGA